MKITIDTKQDSKEEIHRTIRFLQNLLSSNSNFSQSYDSSNLNSSGQREFDIPGLNLGSDDTSFNESSFESAQQPTSEYSQPQPTSPQNAFGAMFGNDAPVTNIPEDNKKEQTDEERPTLTFDDLEPYD